MIPIIVYDKSQCDPRKCTARRMIKFNLAKEAKTLSAIPKASIVLSPFAEKALSPDDKKYAKNGIVVMDLTWKNIDDFPKVNGVEERALPYLLAANPINWGKPLKLNSAEAVMASLIILGNEDQSSEFLKRFNWAPEFLKLNENLLKDYSKAKDSAEVVRIQNEYVESIKKEE